MSSATAAPVLSWWNVNLKLLVAISILSLGPKKKTPDDIPWASRSRCAWNFHPGLANCVKQQILFVALNCLSGPPVTSNETQSNTTTHSVKKQTLDFPSPIPQHPCFPQWCHCPPSHTTPLAILISRSLLTTETCGFFLKCFQPNCLLFCAPPHTWTAAQPSVSQLHSILHRAAGSSVYRWLLLMLLQWLPIVHQLQPNSSASHAGLTALLPIWKWKVARLFHLHFFHYYGWTSFHTFFSQLYLFGDLPVRYFAHCYTEHSYFLIDLQRLLIILMLCHLYTTIIFLKCVDWLLLLFRVFIDILFTVCFTVCFSKIFRISDFVVMLRKFIPTQRLYKQLCRFPLVLCDILFFFLQVQNILFLIKGFKQIAIIPWTDNDLVACEYFRLCGSFYTLEF